jgi:hypothetical protein
MALVALAGASGARAELTDTSGAAYAALCERRGVPLPPAFGGAADPSCVSAGCATGLWHESGRLAKADGARNGEAQSFNSPDSSDIFYYVSRSKRNPGLCVANARRKNGFTDFFGVICQGTNGRVCFWDQGASCKDLPGCFPYTDHLVLPLAGGAVTIASPNPDHLPTSGPHWVGGAGLVGSAPGSNGEGVCSDCHAGENAFVNHPGTATDILSASSQKWGGANHLPTRQYWFPAVWPDPIVPSFDSEIHQAWPQNPGPGVSSHAGSVCFDCHAEGGPGGRFPALSSNLNGYCERVFETVTNRRNPERACDKADRACPNGAMPPPGHGPSPSYPSDPFAKYIRDTACGTAPPSRLRRAGAASRQGR